MDHCVRQIAHHTRHIRLHYHRYLGSFTLTHPKGLPSDDREMYLGQWREWMDACLREQPPPVYREGASVNLFGKERLVRFIHPDQKVRSALLSDDELVLSGMFPEEESIKKEMIERLLDEELMKRIHRWVAYFQPLMGLKEVTVSLRSMRARWGSCFPTKRKIHLSRFLIYREETFLREVVLHEMVHFLQPNHQKEFRQLMVWYNVK